jgi:hypothetical protein
MPFISASTTAVGLPQRGEQSVNKYHLSGFYTKCIKFTRHPIDSDWLWRAILWESIAYDRGYLWQKLRGTGKSVASALIGLIIALGKLRWSASSSAGRPYDRSRQEPSPVTTLMTALLDHTRMTAFRTIEPGEAASDE